MNGHVTVPFMIFHLCRPPGTAPAAEPKDLHGEVVRPRTGPANMVACSPDSSLASARSGSSLTNLSEARGMSVSPTSSRGKDEEEERLPGFEEETGGDDEARKSPSQLSF